MTTSSHRRNGAMPGRLLATAITTALLGMGQAQAFEAGPFTLTGFVKAEVTQASNQCSDCQRYPTENRQRLWADDLVPGKAYGSQTNSVVLAQPWLAANFDLGKGVKLSGLLSQRWRDGKIDIDGFWYEKNAALSHEEWGSLRIGAMTSRAWSLADFPYGTDIGVADAWASSGAGYGLMTQAIRYTSRPLEFLKGDLVLELSYDRGNRDFKIHKPWLVELWAQFRRGDLALDAVYQDSRNGTPMAWGHGPFTGLTPFPADDAKLGGSGQSIAMLMARYDLNSAWQLSGGVRHNRWSGAYAVITQAGPPDLWNTMFNVNWNGTLNGVSNPGYAATSTDLSAGVRYRDGDWTYSAGMVRLGKAKTDNPLERGQSNGMTMLTVGAGKQLRPGWRAYAMAGLVRYDKKGLAPLSMPAHNAFSGVDSRIATTGNWVGMGVVYTF